MEWAVTAVLVLAGVMGLIAVAATLSPAVRHALDVRAHGPKNSGDPVD